MTISGRLPQWPRRLRFGSWVLTDLDVGILGSNSTRGKVVWSRVSRGFTTVFSQNVIGDRGTDTIVTFLHKVWWIFDCLYSSTAGSNPGWGMLAFIYSVVLKSMYLVTVSYVAVELKDINALKFQHSLIMHVAAWNLTVVPPVALLTHDYIFWCFVFCQWIPRDFSFMVRCRDLKHGAQEKCNWNNFTQTSLTNRQQYTDCYTDVNKT